MNAGLLLALFAHLLLMISPLHAAEPPLVGRHEPGVHAHLAGPASVLGDDFQLDDADCGLEWSPPRSVAMQPTSGPGLLGPCLLHAAGLTPTRPLSGALGPPRQGPDRQALLQVFRV